MATNYANNRIFDLRFNDPIFDAKTGRKRKELELTPANILSLEADWIKGIQKANRSKLLCNIPIEYLALFCHADSDKTVTLKGKNIVTNEDIEFRPTYFETIGEKEFSLLNLFIFQMTSENRVSTKFRAFSNNWHAMINSLPWRHNEVMCLMTIYSFIETQFYSKDDFKVNLSELVKECARKDEKREYIRSLYSLLILQDTEFLMVDSNSNILLPKKKLFDIKCSNESIKTLASELKKVESRNAREILDVLSHFDVNFKNGSLGDIENMHKNETGELPPDFIPTKWGKKPNYWKKRIYKGGHLFHSLHPHLNISPVLIRSWSLLNSYQPNMTTKFTDVIKGFDIETFAAISGLSNVMKHKPKQFYKYLEELSQYWGGIEIKDNNLFIKFGYDVKLRDSMINKEEVKNYDLNYGVLKFRPEEESPLKEDKFKNVTVEQLKAALSKFRLVEDDAIEFAEIAKLNSFAQPKMTGKEVFPLETPSFQNPKVAKVSQEKKKTLANEFSENILISRINNLQGKSFCGTSGDSIRENLLTALQGGANQSAISHQLEKLEQFMAQ